VAVLEAILFKIEYQVNTKIDVLSYDFGEMAARWKALYDQMRRQALAAASVPTLAPGIEEKPPYFHTGMEENRRAKTPPIDTFPFARMTE
jgi:hypothetical protein